MSESQPVRRVVDILTKAGFRHLPSPFVIANIPFDFAALLVGSDRALDLVVVIDTLIDSESRTRQKVEGLARVLDLTESRRPLTAILVGPPLRAVALQALGRVSRVLIVGTPVGESADYQVSNAVAVLLPLSLPDSTEVVTNPKSELLEHCGDIPVGAVDKLFQAAGQGENVVTKAFIDFVAEPLKEPEGGAST